MPHPKEDISEDTVFIGPESDDWLPLSLTDWLTQWCLVDLTDVTLPGEDANTKLFDFVTATDVDDENRVGNSLFQIWKLRS